MLFIPALAGYIAYAIADRPGLAPGFVMGGLAGNIFGVQSSGDNPVAMPATGFIGAIIGGVLAGVIAHWISTWKVPTWARGLMPVMVIPLFTSIIAGLLMIIVFGRPIAWLMDQLTEGLNSLNGGSAIVLGVILGLMMAFDMGGPLNKVAYSFAAAGVGTAGAASDSPELKIMAAVMLAGMVPPIALALATVLRPRLFTPAEDENGKAGWALGLSLHHRGGDPVRSRRPVPGHPGDHARQRRDRRPVHGDGRRGPGTARRHLRAVRGAQHPRLLHRTDRRHGGRRRSPSSP